MHGNNLINWQYSMRCNPPKGGWAICRLRVDVCTMLWGWKLASSKVQWKRKKKITVSSLPWWMKSVFPPESLGGKRNSRTMKMFLE
jgi:hypothetical protein